MTEKRAGQNWNKSDVRGWMVADVCRRLSQQNEINFIYSPWKPGQIVNDKYVAITTERQN